jgi:hypothetical protein
MTQKEMTDKLEELLSKFNIEIFVKHLHDCSIQPVERLCKVLDLFDKDIEKVGIKELDVNREMLYLVLFGFLTLGWLNSIATQMTDSAVTEDVAISNTHHRFIDSIKVKKGDVAAFNLFSNYFWGTFLGYELIKAGENNNE